MKIRLGALFTLGMATLAACDSTNSTNNDNTPPPQIIDDTGDVIKQNLLSGTWKQCIPSDINGDGKNDIGISLTYTFNANGTASLSSRVHGNTDCSDTVTPVSTIDYSYTVGSRQSIPAGSLNISSANTLDLTNTNTGTTLYSIVAIVTDGPKLYIGDADNAPATNDGSSVDARINLLQSQPYLFQSN